MRAMRRRAPSLDAFRFALRTDGDDAQLMAITAGSGVDVCQVALAQRVLAPERVLPDAFVLSSGQADEGGPDRQRTESVPVL